MSASINLDVFENKKFGNYTLIVNLEEIPKIEEVKFFLRVFSSNPITLEELP